MQEKQQSKMKDEEKKLNEKSYKLEESMKRKS